MTGIITIHLRNSRAAGLKHASEFIQESVRGGGGGGVEEIRTTGRAREIPLYVLFIDE
jgi:hypothetical protein